MLTQGQITGAILTFPSALKVFIEFNNTCS